MVLNLQAMVRYETSPWTTIHNEIHDPKFVASLTLPFSNQLAEHGLTKSFHHRFVALNDMNIAEITGGRMVHLFDDVQICNRSPQQPLELSNA